MRLLFVILLFGTFLTCVSAQWKTVRVGGGGYVTSMKAHPKVRNLYFITTDVGTPYRWNAKMQAWEGMLYTLPATEWARGAAGDLAVDPTDSTGNVLYITLSSGDSVSGTVLKSTDRGRRWTDCQLPIEVYPNTNKGNNRLAVDPQNNQMVYVTTCLSQKPTARNGMFRSTKAGAAGSWTKINDLCGDFVLFDIHGGLESGATRVIYIGCPDGVHQSTDGGSSFNLMIGSPAFPNRGSIHKDGTLYVSSRTGVYKWNGSNWSAITPPTTGNYKAVAVNPNNSRQVVCCSSSFSPYRFNAYRSADGGASWTAMRLDTVAACNLEEVPWYATGLGQNLTDFCWDPFNQDQVWFTDFFFASQTTNVWATPFPVWKPRAVGDEEVVPTGTLLCPPAGKNILLSSIADAGGWDHSSLTVPPSAGMQKFFPWTPDPGKSGGWGNMSGVAVQETNPDFIARVGRIAWNGSGYAGYSLDGGQSYKQFSIPQGVAGGRVAIAATNHTLVWIPQTGVPQRSTNFGKEWHPILSLPTGIISGDNIFASGPVFPLAADKVNGSKFYVYAPSGGLYVSKDGGLTFVLEGSGLPAAKVRANLMVETTPGKEGDVWVGMLNGGLFHSTNSGRSFKKVKAVQRVEFLAIGKASQLKPHQPAIYILGTVNGGDRSLYRSNDNGKTWENLGVPQIGKTPLCMSADRQVYGRVFIGTGGNGFFYAEGL